jgi:FMN phosphatase YigB (HAD superfamily)
VTASLSNISDFQWAKIRKAGLVTHMKCNFVSCRIGHVEPDRHAFAHVTATLGVSPSGELKDALAELGCLP